ncbi:FAD-dependent thymidylate synthase [Corynebacterium lowii]|uniref:Thymidylate synthase ThyX n=1 Tax=Corynebacterium lowii TaxID=1544413 RepID=A0A0Q0YIN5_9CORY|nr:FAD-dependent thymidylate synthase [Corynebacterium lowii]KQB86581.1 Thymidylate synthase ThyX [Corynebacterium lowii]MDP9851265.1 thymidylate synthase (FAD) [Corynebacterium lowii]
MTRQARLRVHLLSQPTMTTPEGPWVPEQQATAAEAVVEFAGRVESGSLEHPRPRTKGTAAYLRHLQEVARWDLLAHATATVYITGLSRRCAEVLAGRGDMTVTRATPAMQEQELEVVIPPMIAQDESLRDLFLRSMDDARFAYEQFVEALDAQKGEERNAVWEAWQARQAAQAVAPAAVATSLVVTASMRAWRQVMVGFGAEHADSESRALTVELLRILRPVAPALFVDLEEVSGGEPGVESAYGMD